MGNEVDGEEAGTLWTKKICWDSSTGMGQDGAELGERHGFACKAACRTALADNVAQEARHVAQGAWRSHGGRKDTERILRCSALPRLCCQGPAPYDKLLRGTQRGSDVQTRNVRVIDLFSR